MKAKNKNLITLEEFKEKNYANEGLKSVTNWKQVMKPSKSEL